MVIEQEKMAVKLVSMTRGVGEMKDYSLEELVVHSARVSNKSNQTNRETMPKLLKYLIKHKHWSPFEMVDFTVEIQTTRMISRQILRHRSFTFQELSQRYTSDFDITMPELRLQADKNRQSSSEKVVSPILEQDVKAVINMCQEGYTRLTQAGVARECARALLPGCTETVLYMNGPLRSWIHYVLLRAEESTQLEHREIALGVLKIMENITPNISDYIKQELK